MLVFLKIIFYKKEKYFCYKKVLELIIKNNYNESYNKITLIQNKENNNNLENRYKSWKNKLHRYH